MIKQYIHTTIQYDGVGKMFKYFWKKYFYSKIII